MQTNQRTFLVAILSLTLGALVAGCCPQAGSARAPSGATSDPAQIWAQLLDGNRRFVAGTPARRDLRSMRRALVAGQHPKAMVLSCADSRLPPEIVFDQSIGEVFVVRTAGNVADPIAIASLEYGAAHLHVPALVVMGHTRCGAVTAVAHEEAMPTPSLVALRDKIAPALTPLRARGIKGEALVADGIRANVQRSLDDLLAASPILGAAVKAGKLSAIKALYHLETGAVERLP